MSKHGPRLIGFVTAVVMTGLLRGAGAEASQEQECGCRDLERLAAELGKVSALRERMSAKANELDLLIGEIQAGNRRPQNDINYDNRNPQATASSLFQAWTQSSAKDGAREDLPSSLGPAQIDFDISSCDISEADKVSIRQNAICRGAADAELAHEQYHHEQCKTLDRPTYESLPAPARAREEAAAYAIQGETLRAVVADILARSGMLTYEHDSQMAGSYSLRVVSADRGRTTSVGASHTVADNARALPYTPASLGGTLITFPAAVQHTFEESDRLCRAGPLRWETRGQFHLVLQPGTGVASRPAVAQFRAEWPAGQVPVPTRSRCGPMRADPTFPSQAGLVALTRGLELRHGAKITEPYNTNAGVSTQGEFRVTLSCTF